MPLWSANPGAVIHRKSLLVDDSTLHHKANILQCGDVLQWISRHCDHIGEIPSFQSADLSFPSEQLRSVDEIGLQHRQRGHSILHHQHKLARLRAMRKWPDVGTDGEGHPGGHLFLEFEHVEVEYLMFADTLLRRSRMLSEILGDRERGYGEDLLFLHQAHRFITELIRMID